MNILAAARNYPMFEPGDKVIVAVSGGPDSVAMLHALHTHSQEMEITLHIAHLNHCIRGDQSDLDQEFVAALAHEFGIPATFKRIDIPALRSEMHLGEEEAARILRYKFLEEIAAEVGASKIAVGHNENDRAESVLLNIIRGSGINGLGSIRPIRGKIVRPLIDTPRALIEAYIEEHQLPFRVDESNTDTNYARNRIRHELLPLLEQEYNPRITDSLNRLADIAASENDYLDEAALSAAQSMQLRDAIDANLLSNLPIALQRRILRSEIEKLKGNLLDVSFEHVDRVIHALADGTDFTITLPSGLLYAQRRADQFKITHLEHFENVPVFEYHLKTPGETEAPEAGMVIRAEELSNATPSKLPPTELIIDSTIIAGPLRVRQVKPGDRITPFGMQGSKKLQDVFVDKKIHRRDRAKALIVEDDKEILWVVGIIASERTRISGIVSKAIRLSVSSNK
ncbi:MAG: tRNA lysidine(34) synthetase TilS [Armatimonadetes bacterium]|nr:tRNA lysidine(34) synthetase TilS [Armatimonadota bacterium]